MARRYAEMRHSITEIRWKRYLFGGTSLDGRPIFVGHLEREAIPGDGYHRYRLAWKETRPDLLCGVPELGVHVGESIPMKHWRVVMLNHYGP